MVNCCIFTSFKPDLALITCNPFGSHLIKRFSFNNTAKYSYSHVRLLSTESCLPELYTTMVYYHYCFIQNPLSLILMPAQEMDEAECLGIDITASFQNSIPIALPYMRYSSAAVWQDCRLRSVLVALGSIAVSWAAAQPVGSGIQSHWIHL